MSLTEIADEIARQASASTGRYLVGVAGPPASGKSTLARKLADALPGGALVPMDGFHLDDGLLTARGHRDRKGAPHTFDVGGFVSLLRRLRVEDGLYAPAFDRDLEVSRGGAIWIGPEAKLIVVEGNWLLYPEGGWEAVRPALDLCLYLDIPEDELVRRLTDRWAHHGKSADEALAWIEANDLPNARMAAATKGAADRILAPGDIGA